jgi:hypothetical protein
VSLAQRSLKWKWVLSGKFFLLSFAQNVKIWGIIPYFCVSCSNANEISYFKDIANTYSTEQIPWEANRFAASQEISRILWNPKVYYPIYKRAPTVSILSQPNLVHTPTFHYLKFHLNITLPSKPVSPQWSLSLTFSHQHPVPASPLTKLCYMRPPPQSHHSRF